MYHDNNIDNTNNDSSSSSSSYYYYCRGGVGLRAAPRRPAGAPDHWQAPEKTTNT